MGIDTESARFLLQCRQRGVSFRRCATLGRQHYFPGVGETRELFKSFGLDAARPLDWLAGESTAFADEFWHALGTQDLTTIDASDFEGATHVHDMNLPIPETWKRSFDAVCDVGTLEHVFDFPTAIKNAMELVDEGGHFLAFTTANNYFGHGFYQFSPELFYRLFTTENGFEVVRMVAVEYGPARKWYEVADPAHIGRRVTLINSFPVLLFVLARRNTVRAILERPPQQSDYSNLWTQGTDSVAARPDSAEAPIAAARKSPGWKRKLIERAPGVARFFEAFLFSSINRGYSFRNRKAFSRASKR